MTDRADAIHQELEPVVQALGLTIYDVTVEGGPSTTLRVVVDREGGVDLGAIEQVTRALSDALDASDPLHGRYVLEVTSPGLERRLRTAEHFAGAIGMTITVKTRDADGRAVRLRGELTGSDPSGFTMQVDGADADAAGQRVELETVEQARTVFEWGPAPKPGKGSRPGRAKKEAATR